MRIRDYLSDLRVWWEMRPPWMFNRPWWEKLERYPLSPNMAADVERAIRANPERCADAVMRNNALLQRLQAKGAVKPPQTGKHPSE